MKKSKVLAAAFAATMFATAACGLVACDKDAGDLVQKPTGKTYTVTFDADGGTLTGSKTLKTNENGIVTGTTPTATKADNTFTGWSLTKGSTTKINFTSQNFTKNTTVYAMYTSNGVTGDEYTITFMYGEGSGTPATAPTTNGKLAELPTPTAPDGKKFDGWFTAATGGTAVTTNTTFTGNDSIYAQYSDNQQVVVSDNYAMVGTQKYELEETTLSGAEQAYTATIDLTEGDTISFYVGGDVIEAWPGYTWNGMAKSQKASEFTAARTGTFEFNLGYYPANEETAAEATWSVDADDGQAPMLPDSNITLKFADATITIAFDLPNWATSETSYIYIFKGTTPIGEAFPGVAMNGGEITVGANVAECHMIISFSQDTATKQTVDTEMSSFSDGGRYIVSIRDWDDTGDINKFNPSITEA